MANESLKDNLNKTLETPTAYIGDEEDYLRLKQKEDLRKYTNENNARGIYGDVILVFTIFWLISVLYIFVQVGKGNLKYSDAVLITMLTTTTASAIGFLLIIFQYLFNKEKG